MFKQLLADLGVHQTQLLQLLQPLPAGDCYTQYHTDLSPLAWHLGHCVYTELYWVQEVVSGNTTIDDALKSLYIPELSAKAVRGQSLPPHAELIDWAATEQARCREQLATLNWDKPQQRLLQDHYLLHFLSQHYAQHIETTRLILIQRALNTADKKPATPLTAQALKRDTAQIPAGEYTIGYTGNGFHYDNEAPAFTTQLQAYDIATDVVSHGEYLGFVLDGGYVNSALWTNDGWQWCQQQAIQAPMHWQQDKAGDWCAIALFPDETISDSDALFGISRHEAAAFARWAGARLPHEYEWETACRNNKLTDAGQCWEWCDNTFHPYAGFSAYPYDGYSLPWFDGEHYVLRGHSRHSMDCVKRPSFRNYYAPDKRHIHAGLRLCL
ncbi:MAG: SUMF1/EgtB/PvdO family nonheme iron enzyme [Gammaproteobacteria bacterium]